MRNTINTLEIALVAALLLLSALIAAPEYGQAETPFHPLAQSQGQRVYVPIYSHIYSGNKETPFNLTATLSIRNTDTLLPITITRLEYYDSAGKLVKKYPDTPITLAALASTRYVVKEADTSGGSGANFLVTWTADKPVSPPLLESVMIGTQLQQGISFTSRGVVLEERRN